MVNEERRSKKKKLVKGKVRLSYSTRAIVFWSTRLFFRNLYKSVFFFLKTFRWVKTSKKNYYTFWKNCVIYNTCTLFMVQWFCTYIELSQVDRLNVYISFFYRVNDLLSLIFFFSFTFKVTTWTFWYKIYAKRISFRCCNFVAL